MSRFITLAILLFTAGFVKTAEGQDAEAIRFLTVGFEGRAIQFAYGHPLPWDATVSIKGRPLFNVQVKGLSDALLDEIYNAADLSLEQKDVVGLVMSRDGKKLIGEISDQILAWKANDQLAIRSPYYSRIVDLAKNIDNYPRYLSSQESLTLKVLDTKLDVRQKQLLREFYMRRFVIKMKDSCSLQETEADSLQKIVDSAFGENSVIIDANAYFIYLKRSGLPHLESKLGIEGAKTIRDFVERTEKVF